MSYLTLRVDVQAYNDSSTISNPLLRAVDWSRIQSNLEISRPGALSYYLSSSEEVVVFDGQRTISADATTQLYLSLLSTIAFDRYRIAWTGTGTNPLFKTDRSFAPSGFTLAVVLNPNSTITVQGTGPNYAGVSIGDIVYIPGITTGDSLGPFDQLNEGFWYVLAKGTTFLTLARPTGTDFTGRAQTTVAITSNLSIQVFADDRTKVGDLVEISGGFSSSTYHTYTVVAATSRHIEIQTSIPLSNQIVLLGSASNMKIYSYAKRLIYVESDQEVAVRLNGDTADVCKVEPWEAATTGREGIFLKVGPVWRCSIYNKSTAYANVLVVTAI